MFIAVHGLSLVASSGATLCCGTQASYCCGFSCCRAQALRLMGSAVVACEFWSWGLVVGGTCA